MPKKLTFEFVKEQCKELGISFLVIEENNWIDDKEKCLNKIKKIIIGKNL